MYKKKLSEPNLFRAFRGFSYLDDADNVQQLRIIWKFGGHSIQKTVLNALKESVP